MPGVPYIFANVTSNQPLLELDVNFATQITIGSGQVGLGNSMSNITGLGSIQLGTGDTVTTLKSGVFTPTDQSGAGLSFTVDRAVFTQIGTRMWIELTLVYPINADGSPSVIGLGTQPNCPNVVGVSGMWPIFFGGPSYLMGYMTPGTNMFNIYDSTNSMQHNAGLSGLTLRMQFNYAIV